MTKKDVFVVEDFLLHGIGDEVIFVTQASQIIKYNENSTFSDINGTLQKPTCVVVLSYFVIKKEIFQKGVHMNGLHFLSSVLYC